MKELMIAVERAVRPVHAGPVRKRRMRQELLAHLTGTFEEEQARGGDEPAALARALQRFGDPADLARDLQASVPRSERWEDWVAGLFRQRPGEAGVRHGLRLAALAAGFVFVGLLFIPVVLVAAGRDWSDVRIGLAAMAVIAGSAFLSVLAGYGLCRELAAPRGTGSLLRAAAHGVGALVAGAVMVVGGYLTQPENPLWEFILRSPGDPRALGALVWFTGLPLIVAPLAAGLVRMERARAESSGDWASLEIGG